jgi:hypothetical protein
VHSAAIQRAAPSPSALEPAASGMTTIAVPDEIIHYILEYAEVPDIIRARLVRVHTPISVRSTLIFNRPLDAFGGLLTHRTSSQYGYDFSL